MNNTSRIPVAITGHGWEIPCFNDHASLSEALLSEPIANPLFAPEAILGKKGLRYKERATLLALCAAKHALLDAQWLNQQTSSLDDVEFGVVVASNTGNLDTVCNAIEVIRSEHVNATSSMDLPNASSNVVASTIAIRFGLKALNLMVCSGSSASFDALILAANAIRNGRAQRMLVATVETDGRVLRSLVAGHRLDGVDSDGVVLEGAGAVILESVAGAQARGAEIRGLLSEYAFGHIDAADGQWLLGLLQRHRSKTTYVPGGSFVSQLGDADSRWVDLGDPITASYGSAALLQLIHACEQTQRGASVPVSGGDLGAVVVGGGTWRDRRAGALVMEASGIAATGGQLQ